MNQYLLRKATSDDVDEIYSGMEQVLEALPDKSVYVLDDYEYMKRQICETGFAVVACREDGKIVGSFVIRYPMDDEDNLGLEIQLPVGELHNVAHMESAVVFDECRGQGLQGKMMRFAEGLIKEAGFHYLMATVAPYNLASKNTFLHNGYEVVDTKEKYGGVLRDILLKRIE